MEAKIYGWFDSVEQAAPTYNPPLGSSCPYCGHSMSKYDVRTHNIMWRNDRKRSYFYRTHKSCDELAINNTATDRIVWDMIEKNGD